MQRGLIVAATLACSLGGAKAVAAEVPSDARAASDASIAEIELDSGRVIAAPILKETAETLWVDLGFDVLAIPRVTITRIERSAAAAITSAGTESRLYTLVDTPLPERSPRDLAGEIGPAVIKVSTPSGLGSGFVTHPDGYAITNAHVIQGETDITATVFLAQDTGIRRVVIEDIEIVAVNNHIDLALIKMEHPDGEPFVAVPIKGEGPLETGEEVFAIGNPLGLERTLSSGVVATTNRNFDGLAFVQTTAEINPGNSGGPLFNLRGEVVGCTNMGALFADGIGFAIPARYIRDFLDNNEAFAYGKDNPNSGYNYGRGPTRSRDGVAPQLSDR